RCGDINEQRAQRQRSRNRENMLGRISQTSHLRIPTVAADDEDRLHDHSQLHHIDKEEIDRRGKKRVPPQETDRAINQNPARDIKEKEKRRRSPVTSENTPGSAHSRFSRSRSCFNYSLGFPIVGTSPRPRRGS